MQKAGDTPSIPVFPGRKYADLKIGETFHDTLTITETHMVLACGLLKDFNFLHSHEVFGQKTNFKSRIVHGPFTAGVMIGVVGNYFSSTIIALLEQRMQFKAPVRPGDTLTTRWRVIGKEDKPKYQGGVVQLEGECLNQDGTLLVAAEARALVGN